jgi:hypothetical protein
VEAVATWTPPEDMPGGNYQWWVQPWGPSIGFGAWAGPADFSVAVTPPGALTQYAPSGLVTNYDLTYTWKRDVNATWYHLWVGRIGAGTWHDRWYEFAGTGKGEAYPSNAYPGPAKPFLTTPKGVAANNSPTFKWSGGMCEWRLQGWGLDGYGPWSEPMAFRIPHPSNTWYRVYVNRGSTMALDKWTQGTSLPSPAALTAGEYAWWLGVYDAQTSQTIWSDRADFTVP